MRTNRNAVSRPVNGHALNGQQALVFLTGAVQAHTLLLRGALPSAPIRPYKSRFDVGQPAGSSVA